MRFGAALLTAVAVYLVVGAAIGALPQFRRVTPRRPLQAQRWLAQAGVRLSPAQFWVGSAAVGAVTFVVVAAATAAPVVAIVPALSAALLPRAWFARQRAQRMRAVQEAWPDGLREVLAGVSAGLSLPQAVAALAQTGPAPLREAFTRFPQLMRMVGVVAALEVVKTELADPTSDRVIEVLILAHERGGRVVVDVLRDLAEATAEDLRTLEDIATSGLEQRINARAVFVLPWLTLLLLCARPGHFRDFYQSPAGLVVVLVGGVASLVGIWAVGRLGREPIEERVLTTSEVIG